MAAKQKPDRRDLERRLGHRFADPDLLAEALTHVSAGENGRSYQRLEFLGDRVLGLCAAASLMRIHPTASEGELSQRLSRLVRRESCAAMAGLWEVGPHLRLGPGEMRAGGRRNPAILADVAEAILGAVFLDGGLAAAEAVFEASVREGPGEGAATPVRDAKTALQEWAQGSGRALPVYAMAARSGPDHAPLFEVAAEIAGFEPTRGSGSSKRVAEQKAAELFLLREGVWPPSGTTPDGPSDAD